MITEQCIRQKKLSIPYTDLLNIFFLSGDCDIISKVELPEDAKIVFVSPAPDRRAFDFYIESEVFPPVPVGEYIPDLEYFKEVVQRYRIVKA